jgi:hypothetical protein
MLPEWFIDMSVILAYITAAVQTGRWSWKRYKKSKEPFVPRTRGTKDRADYARLLSDYESNLDLLEELVRLKVMFDRGPDEWTDELEQKRMESREGIYRNLEQPMGIFEKLDILESRNPGMTDQRMKRIELETRQAAIEQHLPPR